MLRNIALCSLSGVALAISAPISDKFLSEEAPSPKSALQLECGGKAKKAAVKKPDAVAAPGGGTAAISQADPVTTAPENKDDKPVDGAGQSTSLAGRFGNWVSDNKNTILTVTGAAAVLAAGAAFATWKYSPGEGFYKSAAGKSCADTCKSNKVKAAMGRLSTQFECNEQFFQNAYKGLVAGLPNVTRPADDKNPMHEPQLQWHECKEFTGITKDTDGTKMLHMDAEYKCSFHDTLAVSCSATADEKVNVCFCSDVKNAANTNGTTGTTVTTVAPKKPAGGAVAGKELLGGCGTWQTEKAAFLDAGCSFAPFGAVGEATSGVPPPYELAIRVKAKTDAKIPCFVRDGTLGKPDQHCSAKTCCPTPNKLTTCKDVRTTLVNACTNMPGSVDGYSKARYGESEDDHTPAKDLSKELTAFGPGETPTQIHQMKNRRVFLDTCCKRKDIEWKRATCKLLADVDCVDSSKSAQSSREFTFSMSQPNFQTTEELVVESHDGSKRDDTQDTVQCGSERDCIEKCCRPTAQTRCKLVKKILTSIGSSVTLDITETNKIVNTGGRLSLATAYTKQVSQNNLANCVDPKKAAFATVGVKLQPTEPEKQWADENMLSLPAVGTDTISDQQIFDECCIAK